MPVPNFPLVLGVDGGATKTIAVLADLDGRVLGYGRAGSCDIYTHPGAVDEVEAAVAQACTYAGVERSAIDTAVFSLASADWPEDFTYWTNSLKERHLGRTITVMNDAIGALNCDLPEGDAVVVVCGTGAAIGSRNSQGDIWHSSFWQLTQGGAELSDMVRYAVYRSELGIIAPTCLTQPVLAYYDAASVEDLLHRLTCREREKASNRAGLVPLLYAAAEQGDLIAIDILQNHGLALADFALAAARKVAIADKSFHLLLTGGVFRNPSQIMRTSLIGHMRARGARFHVVEGNSEPVKGAVITALTTYKPVSNAVVTTLDHTFPAPSFFDTTQRTFQQAG
ncbi:hypothetical protein IFT84_11075 [Rhizobium sp. CFBP 8762]|uniref:N-acetylglucosamine kinase n=1 Tax=Rhizobium sp. CFBP 8762 TaxID=2775279 RepID=UPI001785E1B2|nr:BadF/BadG/BcrA/BcrD ATPase family protein [Rhizobium sp. CFBP 8762]MBD8555066.1 hypothetical protein [Rhizobium sp. CFBP 8762]